MSSKMSKYNRIPTCPITIDEYQIPYEYGGNIIRLCFSNDDNADIEIKINDMCGANISGWKDRLYKILTHPIITKTINVIDTYYHDTCQSCTGSNMFTSHIEPNVWYRITYSPANIYYDINALIFHEIVEHNYPLPNIIYKIIASIPDSVLDIYNPSFASFKSFLNIYDPQHWPVIHIQPLNQNYGIHWLAPTITEYINRSAITHDTSTPNTPYGVNDENYILDGYTEIVGQGNNYYDNHIEKFIKKLNDFVYEAGKPDSICNFIEPDITNKSYITCTMCGHSFDQSYLVFRDWRKHIRYQLDRYTSHAIRQHNLPIPKWFISFILYELI